MTVSCSFASPRLLVALLLLPLLVGCGGPASSPVGSGPADLLPPLPADANLPARQSSKASAYREGDDVYAAGGAGVSIGAGATALDPAFKEACYATYQFPGAAGDVLLSVSFFVSNRITPSSPVYTAVGNYATGRWQVLPAQAADSHRYVLTNGADFISPAGNVYFALIAFSGERFDVDSVEAVFQNRPAPAGQWTQLGANAQRTRRAAQHVVDTLNVLWKVDTGSQLIESGVAIAPDGTLYVGSRPNAGDGYLHALNPDGSAQWQEWYNGYLYSSPAVGADGSIYFGTEAGYLNAVNPFGDLRWSVDVRGGAYGVLASPALDAAGNIYFGAGDGSFYALDPEGSELWHYDAPGAIVGSPALGVDGTVYFVQGEGFLHALDSQGAWQWTYPGGNTGGDEGAVAVGPDGTLYYATEAGGSGDGLFFAVWPDGTLRGKHPLSAGFGFRASPAVAANGRVYLGATDGKLYLFDADASVLDTYDAGAPIESDAVIDAAGDVIFATLDGRVLALTADLNLQWDYSIAGGEVRAPLGIGNNGELYVPVKDGRLVAFGPNAPVPPVAPANLQASDGLFTDKVRLTWDEGFDANGYRIYRDGAPAEIATVGYVQSWDDTTLADSNVHSYSIVAFNESGDSPASAPDDGNRAAPPSGDPAFAMFGADEMHTGRAGFDGPRAEHPAWTYTNGEDAYSAVAVDNAGNLYFSTTNANGDGKLTSLDAQGNFRWDEDFLWGPICMMPAIGDDGTIYFGTDQGIFYAYDSDGNQKWANPKTVGTFGPVTIGPDGFLYMMHSNNGIADQTLKLDPADGATLLTLTRGGRYAAPALGSDGCIYTCGQSSGAIYQFLPDGTPGNIYGGLQTFESSPLVRQDAVNGDWVYYASGLKLFAWKTDMSDSWDYQPDNGGIALGVPALAPDGHIVVTCAGGGHGITGLDALTGAVAWESPTNARTSMYAGATIDPSGWVYTCGGSGIIWCLQPAGALGWTTTVGGDFTWSAISIGPEGNLYCLADDGLLRAYKLNP